MTSKEASGQSILAVREFAGVRFNYRVDSIDEQILEDEYHAHRFFADGYAFGETDTILDVGAHIGVFAVLAARLAPHGAVYALEPASGNFDVLKRNIQENDLRHVKACRIALSRTKGTVRLYHAPASWGHTIEGPHPMGDQTFEDVTTETLERFLAQNQIRSVDYMKMNIEGAEYEVLLQAPTGVLESIGCMLVELHPVDDAVSGQLFDRLETCGFRNEVTWSDNPAVKGWLTARR